MPVKSTAIPAALGTPDVMLENVMLTSVEFTCNAGCVVEALCRMLLPVMAISPAWAVVVAKAVAPAFAVIAVYDVNVDGPAKLSKRTP